MRKPLHYYTEVQRPFEEVCDVLLDAARILRSAGEEAGRHAGELMARLMIEVAPLEIGARFMAEVLRVERSEEVALIQLRWRAAEHGGLFPEVDAVLEAYPLSHEETQLSFIGYYEPPLGVLGAVGDSLLLHGLAEAAARRFLLDLARRIEVETVPAGEREAA